VHGHEYYDEELWCFIVPIYQTAIFEQPDRITGETRRTDRGTDLKCSREENPTVRALERILAKIENGEDALAFLSGMATISSVVYLSLLSKGDEVVILMEAYGTTIQLAKHFAKFGVKTVKVWPKAENLVEAISEKTRLVLVETITNPTVRVIDVKRRIRYL